MSRCERVFHWQTLPMVMPILKVYLPRASPSDSPLFAEPRYLTSSFTVRRSPPVLQTMTVGSFQSNSSLQATEKNPPFVRLNMADDRDARVGNSSDLMHWDTFNAANRRPPIPYKPRFYKQLYAQGVGDGSGTTDNPKHHNVYLSLVAAASRYALIILLVLAVLWIPAILQFTKFKHGQVWGVSLLHWSIWLSVFWGSLWAGRLFALILPSFLDYTIGSFASLEVWAYLDFIPLLSSYVALFAWSLASWVSFQPLIVHDLDSQASTRSKNAITLVDKLLFGIFLCAVVLLAEKVVIQIIAKHFHEESYTERIEEQKAAVQALIALYSHTTDIPPPEIPTKSDISESAYPSIKPTASILRQVARNILGFQFILPESSESNVLTALCSANETRLLALRIYNSFIRPGETALVPSDIIQCFSSKEQALRAFRDVFDKNGNGDVTKEEMEAACMECHNEQLSLANSLKDLDSAVGRLDNIFMTMYTFIAILIIAVVLDSQLSTLLIGIGTFILGLSWLIGSGLTEILTSITFLFIKHPYDVGDRIVINSVLYTVREIFLLSTILLDSNNTAIQAPHASLASQSISNIRRSPLMSETYTFDVAFDTKLESLELLRNNMLNFIKSYNRDYLPSFDVVVVDIPGQSKMTLSADIKYKSNWQQGTLRTQRRNRWICALKESLADLKIYGPGGAGAPSSPSTPKVAMYTEVPWSEAQEMNRAAESAQDKTTAPGQAAAKTPNRHSLGHNNLLDKNAGIFDSSQNAFNETEDLAMSNPVSRS